MNASPAKLYTTDVVAPRTLAIAVFTLAGGSAAHACTCMTIDVKTAVSRADLVFRGKLSKVEFLDEPKKVPHAGRMDEVPRRFLATLDVSGVWKGRVGRTIVLHTREPESDCVGFWTKIGTELLVFADVGKVMPTEEGTLQIPEWTDKVPVGETIIAPVGCSPTAEISAAAKTLKELGRPRAPLPKS